MRLKYWIEQSTALPGAPGTRELTVTMGTWHQIAMDLAAGGAQLLALWVECHPSVEVRAVFLCTDVALALRLEPSEDRHYPSLVDIFPCAARMQRAAADLTGVSAIESDNRPWLRHAAWPKYYFPLAGAGEPSYPASPPADDYPFVRVTGDGVHEIPVGPVHAGTIEPGHFRFSVVGEKVLRLEERLGYVHKGIEQRFSEMRLLAGHRLAARVSGDSAVAYSWAYCQALEGMAHSIPSARALWLRALALESERIANHLGDLGALGNDAGFAFGLAQFSRLKELWLRALERTLGERYLLNFVMPGGVAKDLARNDLIEFADCARALGAECSTLRAIYEEHPGVRDRFVGAGTVSCALAKQLGLIGLAGRASGQPYDLRIDLPCSPYEQLEVRKCGHTDGDVYARVAVRFDELFESIRLVGRIADGLPPGCPWVDVQVPPEDAQAVGLVEGWRGPVMIALRAAHNGHIRRCHPHDPSWQNWPVLEHAIIGNIVPDFPLINKSFNLSYSGHDL